MRLISRLGTIALATIVIVSTPSLFSPAISQTQPRSTSPVRSDLKLLFSAADKIFSVPAFQSQSTTNIKIDDPGLKTDVQFQSNTILQAPNRFRSEVKFANEQTPRFIYVSDGKTVSLYSAAQNEYMTMTYQQFDRRNDTFLIGMTSLLYMSAYPGLGPASAQGGFTDPEAQKQLSAMIPASVQGKSEQLNGQNVVVYRYDDQRAGLNYTLAVNPIDALIKQLRFTSTSSKMVMTETIQQRIPNPKVTADVFQFTPPRGARKVNAINTAPGR